MGIIIQLIGIMFVAVMAGAALMVLMIYLEPIILEWFKSFKK